MVNATTMIVWGGYSNIWTGFNGTIYPSVPHIWNVQSESFHDGPDITSVLHPRHQHAGVLGPDGKTIYYIGGIKENSNVVNNTVQYSDAAALMTDIITFDTSTLKWGLQNPTGTIPSTRRLHTLTLLPNSSKILMYGGVGISNSNAVEDVCYTLDLDDNTWQKITFSDNKGLGPRYGHSAVLVKNSLFILFGVNSQGATTSDFGIINTSNLSWVEQYGGLMSDDAAEYPVGARLSGGAIAGVVVGCVAGVAIICGLGAFCFIRRKRNGKYIQGHENKGDMEILEGSNSSASAPPRYDFNQHDKPDGSGARLTLEPVVKPDGA
ncbi:hypothetical protein BCR43DRAFT_483848 [Syncephalastrum racemosum]|uniref:Galactose oxidase n=1 Tax=Syncephalastrum racemosum TaxID=13706 RepID=A0A1X2HXA8_SYNRA|nr:hypothetical protein BCR43DRAFT_483848 [Syncephalastrum racemosum]